MENLKYQNWSLQEPAMENRFIVKLANINIPEYLFRSYEIYNEGEEFFYQVEGDVIVKIIDDGTPRDIHIKQGDIFLLPPRTPHSPQRLAHTVGLVIERKRDTIELDAFMWFCENCGTKLYEESMPLTDIVTQLPPVFERFWSNMDHRTCTSCGTIIQPPIKA